jgi:hypothetical protein
MPAIGFSPEPFGWFLKPTINHTMRVFVLHEHAKISRARSA